MTQMAIRTQTAARILRRTWWNTLEATRGERLRALRVTGWLIWIGPALLLYLVWLMLGAYLPPGDHD